MEFPEPYIGSHILRKVTIVASGALLGFVYYCFFGCSTEPRLITSNPWRSAAYGALMGALPTLENRENKRESNLAERG